MKGPLTTSTSSSEDLAGDLRRITLENSLIRAQFLPELGGKMMSLVRKESGHEFLLQAQRPMRRAHYGDSFDRFDTSGFDECFPTVSACKYPEGKFSGVPLPDHGELWSAAWQTEILDDRLKMTADGRALPYRFDKTVHLEDCEVIIDYTVHNSSDVDLQCLWSSHPLLRVEPSSWIILPNAVQELLIDSSRGARLGKPGEKCSWPLARTAAGAVRIDLVHGPDAGFADKLYTSRLEQGYCALYKPGSNESISFHFDPRKVPFVGLWICQGGWPEEKDQPGHFTVALEPCTGRPDSLAEAIEGGDNDSIAANASKQWTMRVRVQYGEAN